MRVGGKYPDAWHYEHMRDPRATSPGSIMPRYPWLHERSIDLQQVYASVRALQQAGVPYVDVTPENVALSATGQAKSIVASLAGMQITTGPDREIIALIAYLQRLGTDGKRVLSQAAATPAPGADGTPPAPGAHGDAPAPFPASADTAAGGTLPSPTGIGGSR
jgi:cytochrome c oxidase cbb3-type subunit I/II